MLILLTILFGQVYNSDLREQARLENKHILVGKDPIALKAKAEAEGKLWGVGGFSAEVYWKNGRLYRMPRVAHIDGLEGFLEGITLIDFSADWCGPCRQLEGVLEELNWVKIGRVDIDLHPDLKREHKVKSIPTILIYKDGVLKKRLVGLQTREHLQGIIDKLGQEK